MRLLSFFFILIMSIFFHDTNAYASYTCNVTIKAHYSDNGSGRQYTVYDGSFSQSGLARFDGSTPSRTQKCMKTVWNSEFPHYLNETAVTNLLNQLSLSNAAKTYYCNGGGSVGASTPPSWAKSNNAFYVQMKAGKIIGNGTRTTTNDAWIPRQWCASFEAEQAAAQAEQDAAQAAADAAQAEQDAYNAACLTCVYTWDNEYHSCTVKMGFKYSAAPITAADSISEAKCKQRSNYIRSHEPDMSVLPYDVTIQPMKPASATSSIKVPVKIRKSPTMPNRPITGGTPVIRKKK